jgi:LacI family transcriptional regulator
MGLLPCDEVKRRLGQYILEGRFPEDQVLPTINQMARIFNVSPKTVQKAVNALRAEGVISSKRGVGLFIRPVAVRKGKGRRIGFLHSNSDEYLKGHPYPGQMIDALRKELAKHGLSLVPFAVNDSSRMALAETIERNNFSALMLFEIDNEALILELRQLRMPMVSIDYDVYRHGISSVVFDNVFGTFLATRHLLQREHERITFLRPRLRNAINSNQSLDAVEESRRSGYCVAMQDAGLPLDVLEFENLDAAWRNVAIDLMLRKPRTAVVCPGDWAAEKLIRYAQELGARIPEDLSIVGFGNGQKEFAPGKTLTSIECNLKDMGARAARLLLNSLSPGEGWSAKREVIPAALVENGSVAAPRPLLRAPAEVVITRGGGTSRR